MALTQDELDQVYNYVMGKGQSLAGLPDGGSDLSNMYLAPLLKYSPGGAATLVRLAVSLLKGDSAYQVWVKEPGNAGKTLSDFFAFIKGAKGDPFTYADFTPEQLAGLALTYDKLTPEQKEEMKLKFGDLTEADILALQKPATDAAAEVRKEMAQISEKASAVIKAATDAAGNAQDAAENVQDGKTPQFEIGTVESGITPSASLTDNGVDATGNPKKKLNLVMQKGDNAKSPTVQTGTITTGDPASEVTFTFTEAGMTEDGRPIWRADGSIPRGQQGLPGEGSGNVSVNGTGLVTGKKYLFVPDSDGSTAGQFVEYEVPKIPEQVQSDWEATEGKGVILNKPGNATSDKSGFMTSEQSNKLEKINFVPTLDHEPKEGDLTFEDEYGEHAFLIGNQARVMDAEKGEYVFWQLYDIAAGKAVWKKAGSGGDLVIIETLKINLTTNQSQPDLALIGAVIHVKYGDKDTRLIWQGEPLTTTIPMSLTYRVELPEIEGYNTPTTKDYIALAGNTRDLTLSYNTTVLTVGLSGNQSQPDTALNGTVITISYGGKSKQLTWQGSTQAIKVPTGQEITITGASVEGYSQPANDVRTPEGTTDSVTLLYNTTITSISLTSNQVQPDTKLNGIKIAVKYGSVTKQLTWQGSVLSIKIPTGSAYTVTPASLSGYNTPVTKQGTASGATGSVSLAYTTEKVTINVSADDGASVAGQTLTVINTDDNSQLYSGPAGSGVVLFIPFGTNYRVSVNAMYAYHPVLDQTFTAESATRTVAVTYERIKTSRIVQDDSIADPENISGDVNGTVIQQIRSKFRRCLAKKTADGQMTIRYLKNDNSNYYDDGSVAKLDGTEGDVMVYFPRFYYKYENLGSYKFAYSFALVQLDNTWQESTESLLGAYEAYRANSKLYSRSGVVSSGNISQANFRAYARARGTGYQLIDYDQHKMIAWLFYAIYGTRDCQAICGSGTSSYTKEAGQTNSIGNADTTTANGNSRSVNFLDIENCWGNKCEFLDNVIVNNGIWVITDTVTGVSRSVAGLQTNSGSAYAKAAVAGEYLDIIAKEGGMSNSTGYCDSFSTTTSRSYVVLRSYYSSGSDGGVAFALSNGDSSFLGLALGSRLAFRGVIREAESVSAFKSIAVTN